MEHGRVGLSLAEAANLMQAVLLAGVLLVAVRRWRLPFGTFTVILTLFTLAMATQTDAYYDAIAAFATGILADVAIAVLRLSRAQAAWVFMCSRLRYRRYFLRPI